MTRRTLIALALTAAVASIHGIVALTLSSKPIFHVSVATAQRVFGSSVAEKQIFDDVDIYRRYSGLALSGRIPYRDFAVEYPIFAFPLFLIPRFFASRIDHYRWYFGVEMLLFDAWIVHLIFDRVRRAEGRRTALLRLAWYSAAMAALWSLPISRFDLAPTALAFASALAWDSGKNLRGGTASAIGALMKVFPGLVAFPAFLSSENRPLGLPAFLIVLGSGAILWYALGGSGVATSLGYHLDRGLEVGSIPSNALILVTFAFGMTVSTAFRHTCSELVCRGDQLVAGGSTAVMTLVLLVILVRFSRGGNRDVVRYCGASVLGFIVTGKVLSPQYVLWVLPFVAILEGEAGRRARRLFLGTCVLTSLAYPWSYMGLIAFHPLAVAILTARNGSLVVLLILFLFGDRSNREGACSTGIPKPRDRSESS